MEKINSTNPSLDFEIIWEVEIDDEKSIQNKVKLAKIASESWWSIDIKNRIEYLNEIHILMKEQKEDLAKSVSNEMWMALKDARDEVQVWLNYYLWYLENASKYLNPEITYEDETQIHKVFYEPKWVIVAISPWNYPFLMFVWTSIQALLAWNTVIFKTSKEVILTWKKIDDIIKKSSLPNWVWTEVYWDWSIWDILINQEIDFITFTWSTFIWKKIAKLANEKWIWCVMELWWSAPWIIYSDANIDEILGTIYYMRFSNCWQMCDWLKRLLVHESRYEELKQKLSKLLETKKVWVANDEMTDIWPLVSKNQFDNLKIQYQDAINLWAKIVFQSNLKKELKWAYFPPTILESISFDMQVWKDEVFWPILPIIKFSKIEEAIKMANDTNYWLWAYIFIENMEIFNKCAKEIKSGMIQMNNINYCIPQNPFWWFKNSWIWREHWKWWFYEFTNIKVVSIPK
jgi:succinate-semialdehyde dehydrogenase/glutarate-semialdehyde dehydrogenase